MILLAIISFTFMVTGFSLLTWIFIAPGSAAGNNIRGAAERTEMRMQDYQNDDPRKAFQYVVCLLHKKYQRYEIGRIVNY